MTGLILLLAALAYAVVVLTALFGSKRWSGTAMRVLHPFHYRRRNGQ